MREWQKRFPDGERLTISVNLSGKQFAHPDLVGVCREVFESRGYAATTVGAITGAANTAHGTFYLYFKNKEDAFGRVMQAVTDEMMDEARSSWSGDPYDAIYVASFRYLEVFSNHAGLWRCLLEGMHQNKVIEEMWLDLRRPFVERIAHYGGYDLSGCGERVAGPEATARARRMR